MHSTEPDGREKVPEEVRACFRGSQERTPVSCVQTRKHRKKEDRALRHGGGVLEGSH